MLKEIRASLKAYILEKKFNREKIFRDFCITTFFVKMGRLTKQHPKVNENCDDFS